MTAEPEFRWTQDDWGAGSSRDGPSPWRQFVERHGWAFRGAIVLLALLVFELTTNAAVATAVSCLEFGRTDLGTARWLWAVDPDRRRGRLTALCYLAWAFCAVGAIGLLVAGLIYKIAGLNAAIPIAALPLHFIGAAAMMLVAFGAASALSFGVCLAALLSGRKLWVGSEARQARYRGVWPPSRVVLVSAQKSTNYFQQLQLFSAAH